MQHIIACDDETDFLNLLADELKSRISYPFTYEMTDDIDRLEERLEKTPAYFDVLLMDIKIFQANGIDVAARLKRICQQLKVIFITGYIGEYYEAVFLQLHPFGVLAKPVNWAHLSQLLGKAVTEETKKRYLPLKLQSGAFNIDLDIITYIESRKRTTIIHAGEDTVTCYISLTELLKSLPANFLRCHKSFIVNMDYVKNFLSREIHLRDDTVVGVSRASSKEAKAQYFSYIGMRL